MEATKQYIVKLDAIADPNVKRTRYRCGMCFEYLVETPVELTEAQVKEFENDRFFTIKVSDGTETQDAPPTTGNGEQSDTTDTDTVDGEVTTDEDKTTDKVKTTEGDSEETATPTELDLMLRNKRAKLDKIATGLGVEGASEMESKLVVAEAILAAQKATEADKVE